MEDDETEETNGDVNNKKPPLLSKISMGKQRAVGLTNQNSGGSEKITSSSENEVEEIPKDEEEEEEEEKPDNQNTGTLQVNPSIFGRSRTFDGDTSSVRDQQQVISQRNVASSSSSFSHRQVKCHHNRLSSFATKSPHSSSSQEDYEPINEQPKTTAAALLTTAAASQQVTARSMESLRTRSNYLDPDPDGGAYREDSRSLESLYSTTSDSHAVGANVTSKSHHHHQQHQQQQQHHHHHHYRSFLTASKVDVRRIHSNVESSAAATASKSSDNLLLLNQQRDENSLLKAEIRRGLFAGIDRNKPQHLSLPPPNHNFISLTSPGGSDRRIHILSPHSPISAPDFHQSFSMHHHQQHQQQQQTLKVSRRKKTVLPRLVLAPSESPIFE